MPTLSTYLPHFKQNIGILNHELSKLGEVSLDGPVEALTMLSVRPPNPSSHQSYPDLCAIIHQGRGQTAGY
jgi:hypothetical protein